MTLSFDYPVSYESDTNKNELTDEPIVKLYILQHTAMLFPDFDDLDDARRANIHIVITDPNGKQIYMDDGEKLLWISPLIINKWEPYPTFRNSI